MFHQRRRPSLSNGSSQTRSSPPPVSTIVAGDESADGRDLDRQLRARRSADRVEAGQAEDVASAVDGLKARDITQASRHGWMPVDSCLRTAVACHGV